MSKNAKMSREVKCPLCGKIIGEQIVEGHVSLGSLGIATMCHDKLDYRKASHVFNEGGKHGTLCRKCAKEIFKEGKVYYVQFNYHGKPCSIYGGRNGSSQYTTRSAAEKSAARMNAKRNGSHYWVEERGI